MNSRSFSRKLPLSLNIVLHLFDVDTRSNDEQAKIKVLQKSNKRDRERDSPGQLLLSCQLLLWLLLFTK